MPSISQKDFLDHSYAVILDCKGSQFKSSPSFFRTKTLYLSNLQTSLDNNSLYSPESCQA